MKCEVILPRNEIRGEITEYCFLLNSVNIFLTPNTVFLAELCY